MIGAYPRTRLRRLRAQSWCRTLHAEHRLHPCDFVWPIILRSKGGDATIPTLESVKRFSIEELPAACKKAQDLGIQAVALFPNTPKDLKDPTGRHAWDSDNLVCHATGVIKEACPDLGVIADVALDPYTTHGHDGILKGNTVDNDATLKALMKQALVLADAGVNALAPSDMMDGRVGVLRDALDQEDHQNVALFSYGAKYASALYGPFRDACGSAQCLQGADKTTYQMNPANGKEALRELALDIQEGADALIVKPGTFYLDVIKEASTAFHTPIHAYHVSGEYAMLKAAAEKGALNYEKALMENLLAFKRAGASVIWTYAALDAARLLKNI